MSIEHGENVYTSVDHFVGVGVLQREYGQFGKCHDHEPDQELNEVDFVVDVFVKFFPGVSIDVLWIMDRKVHSTLKDQNIVLLGKVKNNGMNNIT